MIERYRSGVADVADGFWWHIGRQLHAAIDYCRALKDAQRASEAHEQLLMDQEDKRMLAFMQVVQRQQKKRLKRNAFGQWCKFVQSENERFKMEAQKVQAERFAQGGLKLALLLEKKKHNEQRVGLHKFMNFAHFKIMEAWHQQEALRLQKIGEEEAQETAAWERYRFTGVRNQAQIKEDMRLEQLQRRRSQKEFLVQSPKSPQKLNPDAPEFVMKEYL